MVYVGVALGGAIGALLRWSLGDALPDGSGFPWTTFAINVGGSTLLALLPAVGAVRRRPVVADALGPGVLGGFTTLSTYSEQTRALLDAGRTTTAAVYVLGTLVACLVAIALASRLSRPEDQDEFEAEGGDE